MTESAVIILAAGRATRWRSTAAYTSKHFVPIWGEPLIHRMLRQLALYPTTVTVLGNTPDLLAIFGSFNPERRTKCESVSITNHLWKEHTHVLCGDVVFSNKALDNILYYDRPVAFYSDATAHELFGFSFRGDFHRLMQEWLLASIHSGGHLWNLFRTASGFTQEKHRTDSPILCRFENDPVTRDFDAMEDYLKWCAERPEPIAA